MQGTTGTNASTASGAATHTFSSRIAALPARALAHREQAKKVVESLLTRKREGEAKAFKEAFQTAREDVEFISRVLASKSANDINNKDA